MQWLDMFHCFTQIMSHHGQESGACRNSSLDSSNNAVKPHQNEGTQIGAGTQINQTTNSHRSRITEETKIVIRQQMINRRLFSDKRANEDGAGNIAGHKRLKFG